MKRMRHLKSMVAILAIVCLMACENTWMCSCNITEKDIVYQSAEKKFYPSAQLKAKVVKAFNGSFSWRRAGYVYRDAFQGIGAIVFEYNPDVGGIDYVQLVRPTNVTSVDQELVNCIKAMRFTDTLKKNRVKPVKFILKIDYFDMTAY